MAIDSGEACAECASMPVFGSKDRQRRCPERRHGDAIVVGGIECADPARQGIDSPDRHVRADPDDVGLCQSREEVMILFGQDVARPPSRECLILPIPKREITVARQVEEDIATIRHRVAEMG